MSTTPWVKAKASGGNEGACVEVRFHEGMIEIRDTKERGTGPTLQFTFPKWDSFLTAVKGTKFTNIFSG